MQQLIDEIYDQGYVVDSASNRFDLETAIDRLEGAFLRDLIAGDPAVRRTVEIGCAYGLSSLHICTALRGRAGASHTIIDPFQEQDYNNVGLDHLRQAGVDFFRHIAEPSEYALPDLARDGGEGAYDLVFIDGWHILDHTMVDLFFANRLLRVGGYVVVDDCSMASVAKAVSYFERYPAYELVGQAVKEPNPTRRAAAVVRSLVPRPVAFALPHAMYDKLFIRTAYTSMVALQKTVPDTRPWDWFAVH